MGKLPNGYGLYDMLGNAAEWVADWYDARYYEQRVRDHPTGPARGTRRVVRGGCYFLPAGSVTTTIRYAYPPDSREAFLGFRCAAD